MKQWILIKNLLKMTLTGSRLVRYLVLEEPISLITQLVSGLENTERRAVELICTWIPGPRQNLITRGTYKNLTEELMTEEIIEWSKKTTPTLEIGTLPRPKLHEGIFAPSSEWTVHFYPITSTFGRLDRSF